MERLDLLGCKENKPDREWPEQMEEILQRFSGVKYLTSLDLTSAYWQVVLEWYSKKYTAFLCNGKNFQFKRLPFGINTSAASFIKCLDTILKPGEVEFVIGNFYDILITSRALSDHLEHIHYVLHNLKKGGLTVYWETSKVCKNKLKVLGYIISPKGIRTGPNKLTAIQNFPEARNLKQLQNFLDNAIFTGDFNGNVLI